MNLTSKGLLYSPPLLEYITLSLMSNRYEMTAWDSEFSAFKGVVAIFSIFKMSLSDKWEFMGWLLSKSGKNNNNYFFAQPSFSLSKEK